MIRYFGDNTEYSADDVNGFFNALGGVYAEGEKSEIFSDTGNFKSDLNAAFLGILSAGIFKYDGGFALKEANGAYRVTAGSCVMPDGRFVISDSDIAVEIPKSEAAYIFIDENATVTVSSSAGDDEKTLAIAETDESGNITDKRKYAALAADESEE